MEVDVMVIEYWRFIGYLLFILYFGENMVNFLLFLILIWCCWVRYIFRFMVVYFLLVRRLLVVGLKFFVVKVDDVINDVEIGIEVVVGGNDEVK